ncbi:hypothetical protein HP548_12575 [Paenibacillus taichungensis]|uniref:Uncharacterized protein n=1 Tax=Paenibacillus taichungensis TaxID=484184 RepID=A0ABX2MLJ2_9BACL|nr:hypothetical protein [Paenibacillus taichungensis]NUU54912.1 hypothetical protein [Paenibacillus taichungensis]
MAEITLNWLQKQAESMAKHHWSLDYIPTIVIDERNEVIWLRVLINRESGLATP